MLCLSNIFMTSFKPLLMFLFANFKTINDSSEYTLIIKSNGEFIGSNLAFYCIFILLHIFSYKSVMDKSKLGYYTSIATSIFVFYIIYFVNEATWFNLDTLVPFGSIILSLLFVLISISSIFLVETKISEGNHPELVQKF